MIKTADVVVVGGGILGASVAHFLTRRGYGDIVMLERSTIASGATGSSAANVRQHYSMEVGIRLAVRAVEMFENSEEELGGPTGFKRCGYMVLGPSGNETAIREVVALQQRLGVKTRIVTVEEIHDLYPDLALGDIVLGCLEENSGYADPVRTVQSLVQSAKREGLRVYEGNPVQEIEVSGGDVTAVVTREGVISTPLVVNAAGPWARKVGEMVGVEHGLVFSREHEAVFELPADMGSLPVVSDAANRIFFRPSGRNALLVGEGYPKDIEPCDPEMYDERADDEVVNRMVAKLILRVPGLAKTIGADWRSVLVKSYAGVYSITCDWYPIVGASADVGGYYTAIGGSGHAFKIGPPIGEAVASVICGEEPAIDISPLAEQRFEQRNLMSSAWGPGNRA